MRPTRRPHRYSRPAPWIVRILAFVLVVTAAGCGQEEPDAPASAGGSDVAGTVRLYTSYSQPEVDAVVAAYGEAEPDVTLEVFRAPTGQLAARIAAEQRSGGIRGDVLLLSDPLSMQQYAAEGQLRRWSPPEASVVPAELQTDTFWAVTTSRVVVVHQPGQAPASWHDLTDPSYRDAVALPDPDFAGSAFGALGYFALAEDFGFDFYRALEDNGAVQVQAPGEVVTGVAEGRFRAGMTLDFVARAAMAEGSPVEIAAPDPGAVLLYAPVGVFAGTENPAAAESFANFLLTRPAQEAMAELDRHPVREDVPAKAPAVSEVTPDWPAIFDQQAQLRTGYREIFGG